jgi:hypothetical protein
VSKEDVHLDHFLVLAEGKREELAAHGPVEEGATIETKLVEVGLRDPAAGVGKLDGVDVYVAGAAKLVGKKVKAEIARVLDGTAYAAVVGGVKAADEPITAETEAEKPTRKSTTKKAEAVSVETTTETEAEPMIEDEQEEEKEDEDVAGAEAEAEAEGDADSDAKPKKKTRRGTRGGRGRKRKTAAKSAASASNGAGDPEEVVPVVARIHLPAEDIEEREADVEEAPAAEAESAPADEAPAKPKKKTRRGTRGGRGRKRKTAAAVASGSEDAAPGAPTEPDSEAETAGEWEYVPMSEWGENEEPGG